MPSFTGILHTRKNYIFAPKTIVWPGITGILLCGGFEDVYLYQYKAIYLDTTYAIFSFLIILGLVKIELTKKIQCSPLFVFLGAASYSIYLTHRTILSILFRLSQHIGGYQYPYARSLILALLILTLCIGLACLYYKLYEQPVMDLIRRKLNPAKPVPLTQITYPSPQEIT